MCNTRLNSQRRHKLCDQCFTRPLRSSLERTCPEHVRRSTKARGAVITTLMFRRTAHWMIEAKPKGDVASRSAIQYVIRKKCSPLQCLPFRSICVKSPLPGRREAGPFGAEGCLCTQAKWPFVVAAARVHKPCHLERLQVKNKVTDI